MVDLMDSIKIIVTNSDTTSITPSPTHYQQSSNATNFTESNTFDDITENTASNHVTKGKLAKRWNLPPLKLSTSENSSFHHQRNEHIDQSDEDDTKKLLLSPLLNKSFLPSQSTTSLNSGKRVKILPSSQSSRLQNNILGKRSAWVETKLIIELDFGGLNLICS